MMRVDSDVARPLSGHIAARLTLVRAATASCLVDHLEDVLAASPPPWAPGRREEWDAPPLSTGLSSVRGPEPALEPGWERLLEEASVRHHRAGSLLVCPPFADARCERVLVLVAGRLRVFRVTDDGRAETTDVLSPGELVLLARRGLPTEDEQFVEALDDVTVCELSGDDARLATERLDATG